MSLKRIAFCNFYDELNKDDFMFRNSNTAIGDDLLTPLLELKKYANAHDIEVATVDVMDTTKADAIVFIDMPDKNNHYFKSALKARKNLYLVTLESKLIRKENFQSENHSFFAKVFTYDDSLIDNRKFFKINYSFLFPSSIPTDLSHKEKLCTMIAGNKTVKHPLELYSKRVEAIRWFEKHHPEDFDLYGVGWNRFTFTGPWIVRALNNFGVLRRVCNPNFPSYRGRIAQKQPLLAKYRFAICYENIRDIPGYITEKIFDCFFAGCVPVYWGANNVTSHIPNMCFIDKRAFTSYEALYGFMHRMDEATYINYLSNIADFLHSPQSYKFTVEHFAKTIIDGIANG